jgi:hypothetical protein
MKRKRVKTNTVINTLCGSAASTASGNRAKKIAPKRIPLA